MNLHSFIYQKSSFVEMRRLQSVVISGAGTIFNLKLSTFITLLHTLLMSSENWIRKFKKCNCIEQELKGNYEEGSA